MAPVFGASPVAEAGQLLLIVAGPTNATEAISPYLKGVMRRGVIHLGKNVSKIKFDEDFGVSSSENLRTRHIGSKSGTSSLPR